MKYGNLEKVTELHNNICQLNLSIENIRKLTVNGFDRYEDLKINEISLKVEKELLHELMMLLDKYRGREIDRLEKL